MTFLDYEEHRKDFDRSPGTLWYYGLGIAGEAGEVADKIKKLYRDKHLGADGMMMADSDRTALAQELGDVLWYLTGIATMLGVSLSNVAEMNIAKLTDRRARSVIHGEGDKR